MESRSQFQKTIRSLMYDVEERILYHDPSEFWMVQSPYEYVEFYAVENQLKNTAIALQLARGLHDGSHRKLAVIKNGKSYRLPYVIHPLLVCRMLQDLQVPLSKEDEDILLASALCHDMIEDIPFPNKGRELVNRFHLDERVYETVKLVSKRKDFTEEEERNYFQQIEDHPLALLVKLSDRGNNVEDLFNMSVWKVHEYVGETNKYFLPMCRNGKVKYPELVRTIEILQDKISSLTEAAEILVDRYEAREQAMLAEVEQLRAENEALRTEWKKLWKES